MVLIAPFLTVPDFPLSAKAVRRVCSVLCFLGLGRLYAAWGPRPRQTLPFALNKVTSDNERYQRNTQIYEACPAFRHVRNPVKSGLMLPAFT